MRQTVVRTRDAFYSAKVVYLRLKLFYLCLKVLHMQGILMPIRKEPIGLYYNRLRSVWNRYSFESFKKSDL